MRLTAAPSGAVFAYAGTLAIARRTSASYWARWRVKGPKPLHSLMPQQLRTLLAVVCGLLMFCCLVDAFTVYQLGFSPDAPMPEDAAVVLMVLTFAGASLCGLGMWLLARKV